MDPQAKPGAPTAEGDMSTHRERNSGPFIVILVMFFPFPEFNPCSFS